MLSEPYGSHYIRWRYQTTSRRRRTIIFCHSFFLAASSNFDIAVGKVRSEFRPLVVLFLLRLTPPVRQRPRSTAADPPLVVLRASSDLSRPGAAAAVQPPCTAWQA